MKKLIVANWKMNPATETRALRLARAEDLKNVVIAPPVLFLEEISKILKRARLGAQDAFWVPKGAYTGEVSAHLLKRFRVGYIIAGHSERRAVGDNDETVNKKIKAAIGEGMKVILCVGEPWAVRKRGLAAAKKFVEDQLRKDLKGFKIHDSRFKNLIVAYEPVWAIGTGRPDKPKDAAEMVKFIKNFFDLRFKIQNLRILYGGSVTIKNAAGFLKQKEIDGALIGGASIRSKEFRKIVKMI